MADSDTFDGSLKAIYTEIKYLREDIQGLEGRVLMASEDHEARLRIVESHTTRTEERQRITTGILATLSLLGSALAAYLGVQR
jgi:hypothetical protein